VSPFPEFTGVSRWVRGTSRFKVSMKAFMSDLGSVKASNMVSL